MEILSNQMGDWAFSHNAWVLRGEERVAYGLIRPTAVCVVTGLGPTEGS